MLGKKTEKWTRAEMIKRPDNLMSSEYTSLQSPFVPSYEKDEVNMFLLMAMEYGRIWLHEKESAKQIVLTAVDNDFLVRRYVKRGLLLKKKEEEKKKPFKMKRFELVPSKIKIRSKEEIDKMMSKFTEEEKEELMEEAKTGIRKDMNEKGKADIDKKEQDEVGKHQNPS